MKQYTTEWARAYLREHEGVEAVAQAESLIVWEVTDNSFVINGEWESDPWDKECELWEMLEHPDGWENSKVTREML